MNEDERQELGPIEIERWEMQAVDALLWALDRVFEEPKQEPGERMHYERN